MRTRFCLLFVALIATMSVFAYDFEYGNLCYNITSDSTAEVTYQKSNSSDNYSGLTSVVIPESVTYYGKIYSVTSIRGSAFYGCRGLTSVTIGNSVTSIGEYAFYGCWNLTSITIPNSVTSIGDKTFYGCTRLTSITIPSSVTSIGKSAFRNTPWYDNQPDGMFYINNILYCYKGTMPNNTSIAVKEGTVSISPYAFYDCSGLTSITIPNSVTSIGYYAFKGCSSLISVIWNARRCANFTVNYTPFYHHSGFSDSDDFDLRSQITSFIFGDEVESIPAYLCYGMEGLTSITIPNSVTSIGESAFSNCSKLGTAYIGNSVTSIGESAFADCSNLMSITIPNSVTSVGDAAFSGCTKLTTAYIGNGVTSVGENAFRGCSNLETVTFGSGLQNIGDFAFKGCQNIYEMTVYATQVPNVVAEDRDYYGTFQGVSKLAELHVPAESVKKYKIHPVWGLFNVITAIPYTVTLLCDNVQGAVVGSGSYQPNEQVTITAKPNAGYRFVQWSDGITTNPRTIVVTSDTTLTAEFEEIPTSEYTVSVVVDPTQHGTVQMTLTAVPDEGYQFAWWNDGNTENPRTILVTENMTLSATFNLSTKASNASAEESQDGTRKVFRNGQMYIIRGEKTYTATGNQL